MIQATEADIGRRVVYDARPILKDRSFGKVAGLDPRGHGVMVQFDGDHAPLCVISNLEWVKSR